MDYGNVLGRMAALYLVFLQKCLLLSLTSLPQKFIVDEGDSLIMECGFRTEHYNMFDFPIIWKKEQLSEETQINLMGSLKAPFVHSNRFDVVFTAYAPSYLVELSILDATRQDSGNYTCEIRGPRWTLLGLVTHQVFVKAPIDRMLITIEPNTSNPNIFTPFSLHLVENRPTLVRCIAFGGYPAPVIDVYIGSRNLSSMFLLKHEHQLMGGIRGLRSVIYRTERWTTELIPILEYNEDLLKCIASVENMRPAVDRTRLNIDFAPRIHCTSGSARRGDRDAELVCRVRARPTVTAHFWVIDHNGTTLSDGRQMNGFIWTSSKAVSEEILVSHLYISNVRDEDFHQYTFVAENRVSVAAKEIELKRASSSDLPTRPIAIFGYNYRNKSALHLESPHDKGTFSILTTNLAFQIHEASTLTSSTIVSIAIILFCLFC